MNKEELIEKGFMPKNVDWCNLYKNGFEYKINGKWTLKLFDGTILCEGVNYCNLFENGFSCEIDGKYILKLFDGTTLCENVDWCYFYKNGFDYEINGKLTKIRREDYKEFIRNKKGNMNKEKIKELEKQIEILKKENSRTDREILENIEKLLIDSNNNK